VVVGTVVVVVVVVGVAVVVVVVVVVGAVVVVVVVLVVDAVVVGVVVVTVLQATRTNPIVNRSINDAIFLSCMVVPPFFSFSIETTFGWITQILILAESRVRQSLFEQFRCA
jgi:hypothetical protein